MHEKHVYEHTLFIRHMFLELTQKKRILPAKLTVSPSVTFSLGMVLEIETVRVEVTLKRFLEPFVFRSQERDVGIVIPGDEAFVPDRAEHGARDNIVRDPVFRQIRSTSFKHSSSVI